MRDYPIDYERGSDVCYLPNDEFDKCYFNQSEMKWQEVRACDRYLEEFDKNKTYPPDIWTGQIDGVTMVETSEYNECNEKARSIDLNCSCFLDEVACQDLLGPDGDLIRRDCSLFFEIPAYENGTIIGNAIEPGSVTGRGLLRRNITSIITDLREDLDISYLINKYTGFGR
jgi:hypothetical protein